MNYDGIKAFIFDMDGVLLDTESLCKRCWRITAQEWGLSDVDSVFYECVGQARQDTFNCLQRFFEKQKNDFNAHVWYEEAVKHFRKTEESEGLSLMPFAKECLEKLKSSGFTLALASSTRKETVERQLKRAGLFDYFTTVTCGDSVVHSKPDPEIYVKACKSLNLDPAQCVAVEDSPNGIKSAYGAGMQVIMVPDQIMPDDEIKKMCSSVIESLAFL